MVGWFDGFTSTGRHLNDSSLLTRISTQPTIQFALQCYSKYPIGWYLSQNSSKLKSSGRSAEFIQISICQHQISVVFDLQVPEAWNNMAGLGHFPIQFQYLEVDLNSISPISLMDLAGSFSLLAGDVRAFQGNLLVIWIIVKMVPWFLMVFSRKFSYTSPV